MRLFVWNFAELKPGTMERKIFTLLFTTLLALVSCEDLDNDPNKHTNNSAFVGLEEVAEILAHIPISPLHVSEVSDAVTSSSGNGYDEEYTMKNLFSTPGAGVGDAVVKSAYEEPLRDLIEEYVQCERFTKSEGAGAAAVRDPSVFLEALAESDIQIYWPFSEEWNGETMPVITFDPEDGSDVNIGYRLITDDDGFRQVEEVEVDEAMAREVPVWVVNRNSDAGYTSLEMLRREDPDWGEGGGNIIVRPSSRAGAARTSSVTGVARPYDMAGQAGAEKSSGTMKCLVLKDFTMHRNYDSWFAGASEFFVKIGYVDDFTAATEAELKLFSPSITDFMIVVKRSQVGIPQNFNAVLISRWSERADAAFLIHEDDGGTRETWSSKAKVYVAGKSYGFEVSFPLNTKDDIVWRGSLAYQWVERFSGQPSHFGDIDLTFELMEY